MKKGIYIIFTVILIFGCDKENVWDCIQTSGPIVQTEIDLSNYDKVVVNRDVELIIREGNEFEIILETGENLLNDISFTVIGGQLQIEDKNSCNFIREYGITKVYLQVPNLVEIRNSSQYEVSSQGVLNFPDLVLTSEDFNEPDSFNVGDFRMSLNSNNIQIVSNNLSSYFLDGQVTNLNVGFFSGDGRFEGANLIADNVNVFHRGTNDVIVNPQERLTAQLKSTGNIISMNQPPIVEVEQFYTGELIFED